MDNSIRSALGDVREGLLAHRAWRAFAANDVTQRHRRAILGRFWIVCAMGVTVGAIGWVYASVMQRSPADYVPFVAAGLVVWYLISSVIAESPTVFTGSEGLLKSVYIPKTFLIARLLYKNLIIFCANLVVVAVAMAVFRPADLSGLVFIPLGVMLVVMNLFWMTLLIGSLATRFRDLAPLTGSAMQVLFLLTPVIYQPDQLAAGLDWITYINPLANLVSVLREPLLGQRPEGLRVLACICMGATGSVVSLLVFARARPMITLWL